MSTTAPKPVTTPIPVQLSESEFTAFILPHLSMPKRGPKCKLGIHYTTVYKVFAKWADDGSLWQAFVASVRHLATEKHLDLRILHGDGTNTVAKKGAMALATRATNTRRGKKSSPSSTIMATSSRPSPWRPST